LYHFLFLATHRKHGVEEMGNEGSAIVYSLLCHGQGGHRMAKRDNHLLLVCQPFYGRDTSGKLWGQSDDFDAFQRLSVRVRDDSGRDLILDKGFLVSSFLFPTYERTFTVETCTRTFRILSSTALSTWGEGRGWAIRTMYYILVRVLVS